MTDQSQQSRAGAWEAAGEKRVEVAPAPPVQLFYANNVSFRMTVFDVLLDFGIIVGADQESIQLKPVAVVAMSPQHAKALAELLTTHIQTYERQFGKLPEAPSTGAEQQEK
jgi:hypothetical protein